MNFLADHEIVKSKRESDFCEDKEDKLIGRKRKCTKNSEKVIFCLLKFQS